MPFSRVLLRITGFNGLSRFSEESICPLIFYYVSFSSLYRALHLFSFFFLIKLFYLINSYKLFLLEFLLAAVVPVK